MIAKDCFFSKDGIKLHVHIASYPGTIHKTFDRISAAFVRKIPNGTIFSIIPNTTWQGIIYEHSRTVDETHDNSWAPFLV